MLGIIGGTGLYAIEGLDIIEEHAVNTPYGKPSDVFMRGSYEGRKIIFLPRHGRNHSILPHEVNYRANIWAFKKLGVRQIVGVSAVGSLQEEVKPGDVAIANQYFDHVKGHREKTFFGQGLVAHISTAEPTCCRLTKAINTAGKDVDIDIHNDKIYACVDGPRLGTRAESFFLRGAAGCDIVGMTNVPEVFLAREAQICYCTIGIATDYDCWQDDPEHFVTLSQVMQRYGQSISKVKQILANLLKDELPNDNCNCRVGLQDTVITPMEVLADDKQELLALLKE